MKHPLINCNELTHNFACALPCAELVRWGKKMLQVTGCLTTLDGCEQNNANIFFPRRKGGATAKPTGVVAEVPRDWPVSLDRQSDLIQRLVLVTASFATRTDGAGSSEVTKWERAGRTCLSIRKAAKRVFRVLQMCYGIRHDWTLYHYLDAKFIRLSNGLQCE